MKWLNKVQLIGYLGKDPMVCPLSDGNYIAQLRLATHDGFTKEDEKRETYWHTIKLWCKKPDYIQNHFMKGSHVLVDGKLVYRKFQDRDGKTRWITEVRAERVMNLDR